MYAANVFIYQKLYVFVIKTLKKYSLSTRIFSKNYRFAAT